MGRNKEINEKNREKSRTAIIVAAKKCFAGTGYMNTKMSDVAKAAGMSYGNVYWYFPTKEELLKTILQDGFAAREAIIRDASQTHGNSIDKIGAIIDGYINLYRNDSEFAAIYISLLAFGGTEFFTSLGLDAEALVRGQNELLISVFTLAVQQKTVVTVAPEILTAIFLSFLNGVMITYRDQIALLPQAEIRNSALRLIGQESVFYL